MLEKIKNKKVLIIIICAVVILIAAGISFALWSKSFTQTGTNTNTTNCFDVTFSDSSNVSLTNFFPQTDDQGLTNTPYQVTVTNNCNIVASYSVILHKENTSTLANNHIKVAVDNNVKLLSDTTSKTSSINSSTYSAYEIGVGAVPGNSTKTINIRAWIDYDTTPEEGNNKTLNYRVTVDASPNSNLLAAKVFKTSVNTTAPTSEAFRYGEPTTRAGITPSGSGLFVAQDDDGDSYYFRGEVNNNYVQLGTYNTNLYTYTVVNADGSDYDTWGTYEEVEYQCNENYNIDFGYEEDQQQECINNIRRNTIASAGDPIIWRVVRINGDGTLRLIADDTIGYSDYNTDYAGQKYVGYTYDNSKICTKASPCTGNEGTNSTIKTYLESFYTNNLQSIDSKIATATYCNDTTYTTSGSQYNYGAYNRISSSYTPQLTCPDTTANYGGNYKLKIGLISADELNMAGYGWRSRTTSTNYLGNSSWFWSGSPSSSSTNANVLSGLTGTTNNSNVFFPNVDVRPVINLKPDVKIAGGDGTESNPYVIDTN